MANLCTLAQVLRRSAREDAERTAVVAGGSRMTGAQVDARSAALAAVPSEPGIGARDRVAIILTNRPEWVAALLSAAVTAGRYDGIDVLEDFEDVITDLPDRPYLVTVGDGDLWYDDRIFGFDDLVSSGEGRPFPEPLSAGDGSDRVLSYTPTACRRSFTC
jgi:hypothetical protein